MFYEIISAGLRRNRRIILPCYEGETPSIELNWRRGFWVSGKTNGNKSCVLNTARREMFKGTTKRVVMRKQQHAPTITDSVKTLK